MMVEGLGWPSKFIYLMKMSKGFVVLDVPRGSVVTGRHSSGVSTQSIHPSPVGLHPRAAGPLRAG